METVSTGKEEKEATRKEAIRKEVAGKRKELDPNEKEAWDHAICRRFLKHLLGESLETPAFSSVYCYVDFRNEAGTREILEELWKRKIPAAVPRVRGREMEFCPVTSWEDMKAGYMGILEPTGKGVLSEAFFQNPLVVVPAVALDPTGGRIGYGGGYYDRFLKSIMQKTAIGLAYEFQIYDRVPAEEHDERVDKILTPKRWIDCMQEEKG